MYGEKVEEVEELRLDLADVKEMYKAQVSGSSSLLFVLLFFFPIRHTFPTPALSLPPSDDTQQFKAGVAQTQRHHTKKRRSQIR